jgi:hypothetical protein
MNKETTIKRYLLKLRRRYKKVSEFRYFYNRKPELKKRFWKIHTYILMHDENFGYSIMTPILKTREKIKLSVGQWRDLWSKKKVYRGVKLPALFDIVVTAIIPAINNKRGSEWKFVSLIGWSGVYDIKPSHHTRISVKRCSPIKEKHGRKSRKYRRG